MPKFAFNALFGSISRRVGFFRARKHRWELAVHVSPGVLILILLVQCLGRCCFEPIVSIVIMDQQAQSTLRKDGTDGKEAEENNTEKETEGQGVGTEVNHQERRSVLCETTSTSTGTGPETFNNQTSVVEATPSATQTKLMEEIADGVCDATKSQIKVLLEPMVMEWKTRKPFCWSLSSSWWRCAERSVSTISYNHIYR